MGMDLLNSKISKSLSNNISIFMEIQLRMSVLPVKNVTLLKQKFQEIKLYVCTVYTYSYTCSVNILHKVKVW